MEPSTKRRRLGDESYGIITERTMENLSMALEVDHMILDFLLAQAVDTCLAHPSSTFDEPSDVERVLLQVDQFYALFKSRYPTYKLDEEIRFRQQLLQLLALFSQRLTQNSTTLDKKTIGTFRAENGARALRWIGNASRLPSAAFDVERFDLELPLDQEDLEENRAHVLRTCGAPTEDHDYEDAFYGTSACVSLLELLPMFMRLTAAFFDFLHKSRNPNEGWLELAADWMLQACLEQYLVYGASGSDAIDEAFAWGYKDKEEQDLEATRDHKADSCVNVLFGDEGVEMKGWEKIRAAALRKLAVPEQSDSLHQHLLGLASAHPIERTEETIMFFLRSINSCIPQPVLAQLASGQLDGMSEEETRRFVEGCGLDLASFLAV